MFDTRTLWVFVGLAAGTVLHAQTPVPTVSQTIAAQTLSPGGAAVTISLGNYFGVPNATGQVVRFDTVVGKFDVALRPDVAPQEVANFLGYVQRGDYANTFFHRSASLDGGPISIVQGGGYYVTSGGVATIQSQPPVPLEYNLPNQRGTIAAARTSDPNSATSQWYFNVRDNTSILGPSNGGGYTVFGSVIGSGMSVVDAVAALPRVNAGSPFDELPVRNYSSGNVQNSNLVVVNSITTVPLLPTGSGASALTFSIQNSASGVVAASLSGSNLTLSPAAAGNATITVTATDVNGDTATATFNVSVTTASPSITAQPQSYTVATGNTVVFHAAAANAETFQWQHNGNDIGGATDTTLMLRNLSSSDAGNYTLIARNGNGSATSNAATLTVVSAAPSDVGRLANLSVRAVAGTGDQTLIAGFGITGSGNMPLLLRGMGPSLTLLGLNSYLADPVATLYSGSTAIASNDNWGGNSQVEAWRNQVGAFSFTSSNSLDAAMAVTPAVGTYTMQITGNGGGTGNALAEIYDATSGTITTSTPRLTNISARTNVGTGDNILIAGFVIHGSTAKTVLIRANGPALTELGLSSGLLANPKLLLFNASTNTMITQNDDWAGDAHIAQAAASVGGFPVLNGGSTDAAMLITLPPGNYTAEVMGADGGTGIALIEVYEVP